LNLAIRLEAPMPASKSSKKSTAASTRGRSKAGTRKKAPPAKAVAAKKPAARKTSTKKPAASKAAAPKAPAKKATKKAAAKAGAKSTAKRATAKRDTAKKASARTPAARKPVAKKPEPKKVAAAKTPAKDRAANNGATRRPAAKKKPVGRKRPLAIMPERAEPSFAFSGPLKEFKPYQPSPREEYMSDAMRRHFRQILLTWQQELMEEVDRTVHHMKDEAANFPDPNDRATQESEFGLELRTRDRERKLLKKIEQALARIEDGTYGYCSETGEEIGLRRLEARPVATLTVEAQERRELAEKQYRDRDDR
jgi:DnaK suppressor protein